MLFSLMVASPLSPLTQIRERFCKPSGLEIANGWPPQAAANVHDGRLGFNALRLIGHDSKPMLYVFSTCAGGSHALQQHLQLGDDALYLLSGQR
jgi:hypothetical protein